MVRDLEARARREHPRVVATSQHTSEADWLPLALLPLAIAATPFVFDLAVMAGLAR
jgi:hypothetical protein